ncbi:glucan endo-1,3-beta-glucosidase 14 isoform X1 [Lycium barbarum]|uniref:glucan endo-1,3-beta-glucosidase 14 isoform X1 n=1 Tax=Lycium barbarum TaxID=112863 RepID=UPI00293E2BB0|nr:glucan endo-1,3-beta-glucosidase 14 isoform X1 [Lycium barbarum]XP_060169840.1 glucan endo-1,3-beta-glucosidase 14 isoform X1 [Lycium barbarum]XP_060169841.1 glucan endo-1,3-beta-glucosidase 14 isoform X1 [Lycium barbarum]
MAILFFNFKALLLLLSLTDLFASTLSLGIGINYGQIANNLPTPSRVSTLLRSLNVTKVKLYDADPNVLTAFANTNVEFVIGLGNENLQRMSDPQQAQSWIQQHVQPYHTQTKITCITVGNEVLTGDDMQLKSYLLPAMQGVYKALVNLGLSNDIYVAHPHSAGILENSFPPSSGSFKQDLSDYIRGMLNFHAQTKSPFLINVYPFFAYKDNPNEVPLDYVLFRPNQGTIDPATNLKYDNMLYAQIDAVYSAIKAMGYSDIPVKVSETGWPSKGDQNEFGATRENAALYNGNLFQRIQENQGTPANPSEPIDVYVFALFNENLKPGPGSERNYGLYYPDGTAVYNIGLQQGFLPRMDYSAATKNVLSSSAFLLLFVILF